MNNDIKKGQIVFIPTHEDNEIMFGITKCDDAKTPQHIDDIGGIEIIDDDILNVLYNCKASIRLTIRQHYINQGYEIPILKMFFDRLSNPNLNMHNMECITKLIANCSRRK